jgi:cell division protein FtsI/penicillin-binding protein 2
VASADIQFRQVCSALESQAYRTVREPAVRGSIFDKNGTVLASSRPAYSISLYVKDLSKAGLFNEEYKRLKKLPEYDKLTVTERSRVARFNVASNTMLS